MPVETMPLSSLEKKGVYSTSQLAKLKLDCIPKHLAIIPDGNRRWAKKRQIGTQQGHREGADVLMDIVKAAKELGVQILTFYAFSTENWERPPIEVQALMSLIASYLTVEAEEMVQNGVKLETIGNLETTPDFLQEAIQDTKKMTQNCTDITLVLAINYGARDELCRAVKQLIRDQDRFESADITEKTISSYLDTRQWPDPDLLIRAGGELRISNFLLWQLSYTEIYSTSTFWPDFTSSHLLDAILDYQTRERRLGGGE